MSRRLAFYALVMLCLAVTLRFELRLPVASAQGYVGREGQASQWAEPVTPVPRCEAWDDGTHGRELGCWDELTRQQIMIKDIRPGRAGSDPYDFTAIGGNLYFLADDGRGIPEMWRTDGTAAGTLRTRDLETGLVDGLLVF